MRAWKSIGHGPWVRVRGSVADRFLGQEQQGYDRDVSNRKSVLNWGEAFCLIGYW